MKTPFVSIIIPVYNVEKYLNQCVDSVLDQKLEDAEIILVDDGSPDNCPVICDCYAQQYECIRVIHKKNGGLSSARNAGIQAAKGKYLIFLDSDDWWNPEVCVRKMLHEVEKNPEIEMFLFTSYDFVEGLGVFKRNEHKNLKNIRTDSVENYYHDLLNNGNLEVHASTKILKRSFLLRENLFFQEGLLSEDNQWMMRLLRRLKSVQIIDEPLYIYRAGRQDSITHTIKKKNITDLLEIINESIEYYQSNICSEKLKTLELCYASYLWFSALGLSTMLAKIDREELRPLFKNTSDVCNYSNSKKTRLCNNLLKILGFDFTMFILGIYIKEKGRFHINKHMLPSKEGEKNG